ncbi:hypothetical protein SDRG_10739 [Saprolegnia diclina VS20]|uniref:START domain-containing protein n=1 Tax=Saprolegnia diclina (strain VS20) TaxID=1156394 RepID=T0RNJ4_SAPDV|nr:hypothetical protein SDRG_10739 [Saprolegnia diclina VS20]EQC31567.1 hypothetical protein SDRG_10739 [Saprolegnia diclina VS20]|eukprot:XP_008614966.1 hypothetical protein SDRG_10739 [Saprolegnia diclina VS20]
METGTWMLDESALLDLMIFPDALDESACVSSGARSSEEFKQRERARKVQYRKRLKDEATNLAQLAHRLGCDRDRLLLRQQERRRKKELPTERDAIARWSATAKELREHNTAAMHLNQSLRESLRHQINLVMSYQRTLFHMNLALAKDDWRSSIYRMLHAHLHEGVHGDVRSMWERATESENRCHVTLNASQTDIAHVDVIRCSRRQGVSPSDTADAIWRRLTGESTQNVPNTRIAQRLETLDHATCCTRVYFCDDTAPFALNVVQHRYDFFDKHVIVYRTLETPFSDVFQHDVLQWHVMCWVEVTPDGDDTRICEYIRYKQVGAGGILPLLLGCQADAAQLKAWMEHVVSSLYSCCAA